MVSSERDEAPASNSIPLPYSPFATRYSPSDPTENFPMTLQAILLPLFVEVGLTFFLMFWMAGMRTSAIRRGDVKMRDIALGQPAWPEPETKAANAYHNQFQLPVLFYVLTILAIIARKADL